MIPAAIGYDRPSSLDEALSLLEKHGDRARLLAGGQSLVSLLRFRLATPERVVDLGRIGELRGIERDGDGWRIGSMTTYTDMFEHAELVAAYPVLGECVDQIGDVQVRNRGTAGGALAHCDPVSDFPALALALDGEVAIRSSGGERRVLMRDFVQGPFATALKAGEILAAIHLPPLPAGAGSAWSALEQAASGYSIVGVAAVLGDVHGVLGKGTVNHVRVAVTGACEAPYRATAVEEALNGSACTHADIRAASELATDGRQVVGDIHADSEYRTALAKVHVRRALEGAWSRVS